MISSIKAIYLFTSKAIHHIRYKKIIVVIYLHQLVNLWGVLGRGVRVASLFNRHLDFRSTQCFIVLSYILELLCQTIILYLVSAFIDFSSKHVIHLVLAIHPELDSDPLVIIFVCSIYYLCLVFFSILVICFAMSMRYKASFHC